MLAVCLFKAATSEMFKYVVPNVQMSVTWWSPTAAMAVQAGGAASSPAQPSSTTGRRWARVSYSLMSPWREQRAGAVVVVPVQARSDTQTGRRRQRESAGTFRARQVGAAGSARSHTCIARSGDNPVKLSRVSGERTCNSTSLPATAALVRWAGHWRILVSSSPVRNSALPRQL